MWIIKVGDWYLDGFDNKWDIQQLAYRFKTRRSAESAAMSVAGSRVVKLVPAKDYVVHYVDHERYVARPFVCHDGTPDFYGTFELKEAGIFEKKAAEMFAAAWNKEHGLMELKVSCLNP
jgi:hypothetical protein